MTQPIPDDDAAAPAFSDEDVDTVLDALLETYGYEFHGYQQVFIRRRLRAILSKARLNSLPELSEQIRRNPAMHRIVMDSLSISVTEMFRDPELFLSLRRNVVPVLATYPFVRIWVAGCASGEEAFSLSILLHEEGMGGRFQIYATDIHETALARAKAGLLSVSAMQANTRNYQLSGGIQDFSTYYTAGHDMAILGSQWRSPILFSQHDLAQGSSFNEFELIMCRNVMIYFDKGLRQRVHNLLYESLAPLGFLVLGQKEAIRFSSHDSDYLAVDPLRKVYKKKH